METAFFLGLFMLVIGLVGTPYNQNKPDKIACAFIGMAGAVMLLISSISIWG